nr:type II secretion system F family protein [uncultured Merdimonas sp.]
MTKREWVWIAVKAGGITGVTAWLYYRSVWAVICLIPLWIWHWRLMVKSAYQKKENEFALQFKEAILAVSSALNTGYSVENAFREAQKELRLIYPDEARISKELQIVVRQLRLQVPVEQALEEFAERVEMEDIRSFAAVFISAKRSGGDMMAIIKDTARQIGDKIDVKREIDTILAAKQYEFRVMSAVPYVIIGYMTVSFPEFMGSLYGNVAGTGVMTVCLMIYLGAYYLGLKIIRIEV